MKTKNVTDKTGIDRETLRFYESKGLLPKLGRTESGVRIYPSNTIDRLNFIQMAKKAGFTLLEIKELIELQQSKGPCRKGRDRATLKRKEITLKIKALQKMDKVLTKFISECEKKGEIGLSKPCHFSFEECC